MEKRENGNKIETTIPSTGTTTVTIEEDDAGTLHDKLMLEGNKVIVETIEMIENGCANAISQNRIFDADTIVLKPAPKIFKNDCYINWNKQKNEIKNFVRGLSPYPAAHALLKNGDEEILDLKIFEVEIEEKNDCDVPDFKVITDGKSFLKVVLRDGFVKILKIQQPGKKVMPLQISTEYLARIISSQNKVDDNEETLILSEELQ